MIVSTGAKAKMLGLDNEMRLIGHGVSTCATCDGFFFKGETIAVVGGGDSALEEAIFLTKFASKVYVIHRRDELRASKIMQERAFKNDKIEFVWDSVPVELLGDKMLEGVKIRNVKTDEETVLDIAGLFVAIGHVPNTSLFVDQLDMDENGYLRHHHRHPHQRRGRLRRRRRGRPRLPPGHHRRRHRLHGGHRRRALARGASRTRPRSSTRPPSGDRAGRGIDRPVRAFHGQQGEVLPRVLQEAVHGRGC